MKKLLVVFLSILLLLLVLPTIGVAAAKNPTIVVSGEKANAGDTVKITVSLENNPGIISMKLKINYDSQALKLIDHKAGEFASISFGPKSKNPFTANWIEPLKPNNKTNGVFTTLTFEVLDTALNGKSEVSVMYDPDDVFDSKFNNVDFAIQNGYVDITNSNASNKPIASLPSSTTSQTSSNNAVTDTDNSSTASDDTASEDTTSQEPDDLLNSSSQTNTSSTTSSQTNSGNDKNNTDDSSLVDSEMQSNGITTDDNGNRQQNNKIIWIVVLSAIVVLVGAFVIVIIRSKKK